MSRGSITLSRKEIKQIEVFELLKQEEITQCQAALRLGWSTRWVREKFKRYLDEGVDGLVHQSRGRSSNRKWDQKEKDAVLRYIEEMLPGFGPTLAYSAPICLDTI